MKSIKYSIYALTLLLAGACNQEVIELQDPEPGPVDTSCQDASGKTGTADFTKLVTIGNSFVAGMQGGALFTDGQDNSLAVIVNKQMDCVRGSESTFIQPDIKATLGWNLFVTQPFLADNTKPILGRMLLQYGTKPDCSTGKVSPSPTPQAYAAGNIEALPSPINPNFLYGGSKTALNNFAIPAITLGQALIKETGAWAGAASDPRFSPFYGRLAYPGTGTSTVIGDAAAAGGSFFVFWLGLDDFFLYAAFGGDPTKAPLTPSGNFAAYYNAALSPTTGLLASNPNLKGVVGNFPDIFKMPHFTAVSYNPIPLDAATASQLTFGFAGYNTILSQISGNAALLAGFGLTAADLLARQVTFTASCTNRILMNDETLTDLGPVLDYLKSAGAITDAQRAALAPYQKARQTTSSDIIPLSTGSVLGTPGTFGVNGVSEPLGDRWVIVPAERDQIIAARTAYNATVSSFVDANSTRLAFADVDALLNGLITNKAGVYNGVTITPNINPPTGIYSEDGVHPNTRGYAFISHAFISAINAKFGSSIPLTKLSDYQATGLPIQP